MNTAIEARYSLLLPDPPVSGITAASARMQSVVTHWIVDSGASKDCDRESITTLTMVEASSDMKLPMMTTTAVPITAASNFSALAFGAALEVLAGHWSFPKKSRSGRSAAERDR